MDRSIVSFGLPSAALQGARLALDAGECERAGRKKSEDRYAGEEQRSVTGVSRDRSRRLLSWRGHRDARQGRGTRGSRRCRNGRCRRWLAVGVAVVGTGVATMVGATVGATVGRGVGAIVGRVVGTGVGWGVAAARTMTVPAMAAP
jgi:hypothetical protein